MNIKSAFRDKISDCIFRYRKPIKSNLLGQKACRVLMYHSIERSELREDRMGLAVPAKTFYMHMRYLKENEFYVMDLPALVSRILQGLPIHERSVVITFDDGFRGVLTNALRVLKEFNFKATLFVNIHFVEKDLPENLYWHDWPTLDWAEIRQLYEQGLSIGSHGTSHRKLTELDNESLISEIAESKELIEKNINSKVYAFSYPRGAFNKKVIKALKDNNFHCACSSIEGVNNACSDIFALRRTEITAFDDEIPKFEKKILGCYDWLVPIRKIR